MTSYLLVALAAALLGAVATLALFRPVRQEESTVAAPDSESEPGDPRAALLAAFEEPALIVRDRKVAIANAAARALLGAHIEGVDVRLAIRHPAAAERLAGPPADPTQEEKVRTEIIGLGEASRPWLMSVAPLGDGGRLDSSIDLHYESRESNSVANYPIIVQKGYVEVDARIAYTLPDGDSTLAIGARNLFDETYYTTKTLSSSSGSAYGTLARPREIYAQFTYRFGS